MNRFNSIDGGYIQFAGNYTLGKFVGLDAYHADKLVAAFNLSYADARSLGDLLLRETLGPPQPMTDEQVRETASDRLVAAAMKVDGISGEEEIKTAFLTLAALVRYLPQYNAFARALVGA